jgi:hypothetical protein
MVDKVAAIEKKLSIYDLAKFTPKPESLCAGFSLRTHLRDID